MHHYLILASLCGRFSREMVELLKGASQPISFGNIGTSLIAQSLFKKLDVLEQPKEVIVKESLDFLSSICKDQTGGLAAIVAEQLQDLSLVPEKDIPDGEAAMNLVADLSVDAINRSALPGTSNMDYAAIWFVFGVVALAKAVDVTLSDVETIAAKYIQAVPFDQVQTVPR